MEASKDVASPPAKRVPMERRGYASIGENKIQLLTNHFKVRKVLRAMEWFYHYSVSITYEDGTIVDPRNVGRRIMKNLQEEFITELNGKEFAYDGDKNLYTVCEPLPRAKLEFRVVLLNPMSIRKLESADLGGDDNPKESVKKRSRGFSRFKTYKVAINLVGVIPIDAAATALRGQDSNLYQDPELFQKAVRVLNVILQQNAAKRGCFLVHQSFFHNEPKNFMDIGGGVVGCRGFHSSFRATQGGLSLNIADVSTTLLVKPGSVMDFLLGNQRVKYPNLIKWDKAEEALKNLRIKATHSNLEYKITGLSTYICYNQMFPMKQKTATDGDGKTETKLISVFDYFLRHYELDLKGSKEFPCINVGKPERPIYIPIELCSLVSLQRYTGTLSNIQKASLAEKSRLKPPEQMRAALNSSNYNADPLLLSSRISINEEFTRVQGRILAPPMVIVNGLFSKRLRVGNGKRVVLFCSHPSKLLQLTVGNDNFIPRNGRWNFNKRVCHHVVGGYETQAIPTRTFLNPIKIESWAVVNFSTSCDLQNLCQDLISCGRKKGMLGGDNFRLSFGMPAAAHQTLIVGMDVSHGSTHSGFPSIAAVVNSQSSSMYRYHAAVRIQTPKQEMIESLFQKVSDTKDNGIFRDGVSESQFNQVLNIEFNQIIEACKFLGADNWSPKFMLIVAQKNHHTKFFQADDSPDNVPPGTVVEHTICHPKYNDFYMCAHAGVNGTTRPTHYHVLVDEIGYCPTDLQELVHCLSYA
ncbi:Protein argonaute 4 [Abeliophyllum distichum]|uniref:Protein argonaute 4 n=1 Tax=Abeliophyllum distichum TaxID=126358 RepID=A0ABD1TG56_9LAMI